MFLLHSHLYTSKISLKPFQLLSKKNSGISPSMNLSHSFSLSLLDLHLTCKNIIINCKISQICFTYQLAKFGIRKSVKISSHTIVPTIFSFNSTELNYQLVWCYLLPPTLKQKILSGSSSEGSCVSGWKNISSFSFSQKTW